jgi:hypothetical protein
LLFSLRSKTTHDWTFSLGLFRFRSQAHFFESAHQTNLVTKLQSIFCFQSIILY